jgi:putative (di)nucleoside polyphosphate hydrolase
VSAPNAPAHDDHLYRPNVGIMLLNPAREVFVGRRIDWPAEAWQMPQGGVDKGEDPLRAAFRELKEETGTDKAELVAESRDWIRYDVPEALAGRLWRGRYRGQRQKWFLMRFTGSDDDFDLATHHPEFSAWRWVAAARLADLVVPFKRPVYLAIVEEFRPYLESAT